MTRQDPTFKDVFKGRLMNVFWRNAGITPAARQAPARPARPQPAREPRAALQRLRRVPARQSRPQRGRAR